MVSHGNVSVIKYHIYFFYIQQACVVCSNIYMRTFHIVWRTLAFCLLILIIEAAGFWVISVQYMVKFVGMRIFREATTRRGTTAMPRDSSFWQKWEPSFLASIKKRKENASSRCMLISIVWGLDKITVRLSWTIIGLQENNWCILRKLVFNHNHQETKSTLNMNRNQPITTKRSDLLNLLKKALFRERFVRVSVAGEKRKR